MNAAIRPMLAAPSRSVPTGADWIAQLKYDGWRCIVTVMPDGRVRLTTRTAKEITSLPYIEAAFAGLPVGTVLDGEIVDLSPGASQWNRAQKICSRTAAGWVHVPHADEPALTYVVFDALSNGSDDWMHKPLRERLGLAQAVVAGVSDANVQFATSYPSTEETAARFVEAGWEGVVCKRLDDPYMPADRGRWVKFKPFEEVEAVCTGTYEPKGGSHLERDNCVGGITFDWTRDDGTVYHGKCAGKMDKGLRAELQATPEKFVGLVVEVIHWGVTEDGALRHPNYRRFRDPADKPVPNTDAEAVARSHAYLEGRADGAHVPAKKKRGRNYRQMKDEKLLRTAIELAEGGTNEATSKADDVAEDLAAVQVLLKERGLL